MTRVLDHIFYAEFNEYSEDINRKRFSIRRRKKKCQQKFKAPVACQYFRSIFGLIWLYPAALAEAWFSLFLGCEFQQNSSKKLK